MTPPRPRASRAWRVSVVSLLALAGGLLTSCVDDGGMLPTENYTYEAITLAAIDELMALPSVELVEPTYDDLAQAVRQALDDEFGVSDWDVEGGLATGPVCSGRFQRLEGRSVSIMSRTLDRPLEGDDWMHAVDVVTGVVGPEGFTHEVVVADQPGSHQTEIFGARDSVVRMYSNTSFGVTVESGCYLRESDRSAIEQFGVPDPEHWRLLYPDSTAIPTES